MKTKERNLLMTKRQADAMLVDSVFNPEGSLTPIKYDCGKYKWLGSQRAHIEQSGEEINKKASDCVRAVWFERRSDQYGAYCQIMCLCDYSNK